MNRIVCAACVVVSCTGLAWSSNCFNLQRSGCGTGGDFCKKDQVVCDTGYAVAANGVAGTTGPLGGSVKRRCYRIGNTITSACNSPPGGSWQWVGCAQSGVCCWANSLTEEGNSTGNMTEPSTSTPCTGGAAS